MKADHADVLAALHTLEWQDDGTLHLPNLPPEVYSKLKNVLALVNVNWDKAAKIHRFTGNPAHAIRQIESILHSGKIPKRNPLQFFPTPPDLAREIAQDAINQVGWLWDIRPIRMLEPSAGAGALIHAFLNLHPAPHSVHVEACEYDPQRHEDLEAQGICMVGHDFLDFNPRVGYDLILMNPPFNLPGDSNAWATHVTHACTMLKDQGVLISIIPNSPSMYKSRFWDTLLNYEFEIHDHPPGAFVTSGTPFPTATLIMRKEDQSWRLQPFSAGETIYPSWHAFQGFIGGLNSYEDVWEKMERLADQYLSGQVTDTTARKKVRDTFNRYALSLRQYSMNVQLSERDHEFIYCRWCEQNDIAYPEWSYNAAERAKYLQAVNQHRPINQQLDQTTLNMIAALPFFESATSTQPSLF